LLYFCDESGTTDDTYLAVGGIAILATRANAIRSVLRGLAQQCNVTREIKWSNTSDRRDGVHRAYVDYLFALIEDKQAHLHIRFSKMSEYDHKLSGARRKIDTVSKAYFQLLLHRPGQYYCRSCDIFVYPDKGECTELLPGFRGVLNAQCRNRYGHPPFHQIEPRDSKNDPILQMLDVALGALGAVRNERHKAPNAKKAKKDLAEYVLGKTGLNSVGGNSPRTDRVLSIWNATPMWEKGQRPRS
jgi:hypothetical protein